jgi:flavodoxin
VELCTLGAMNVVILYESLFGNTHQVAEAIAEGAR